MKKIQSGVKPCTILIVEDHDTLRDSLKKWLAASFPDCSFFDVKNGEDAVDIVKAKKFDIVIMDIGLPGISGIEATKHIRTALPDIQVIILTIHDAPDYKNDAVEAGAFAFVPKHKMFEKLIPLISKLLSEEKDASNNLNINNKAS